MAIKITEECINCGACEPECPVDAIFDADSVPPQWQNYIQIERDFFTDKEATEAKVKEIMDGLPTDRPMDRRAGGH